MEEDYKRHSINFSTWHNPDGWKPNVRVTDLSQPDKIHVEHLIFSKRYSTQGEAEQAGLSVAKKWIDDGKPALHGQPIDAG
jgi:hypothetical protein